MNEFSLIKYQNKLLLMRLSLSIFIFFLISLQARAQCTTEVKYDGDQVTFQNELEYISDPGGGRSQIVYSAILVRQVNQQIGLDKYQLMIASFEINNSNYAIPRRIDITFDDRSRLNLDANSMKMVNEGYLTVYDLNRTDLQKFKKPIIFFNFIDTRKNENYLLRTDYSKFLVEQYDCIENYYNREFR